MLEPLLEEGAGGEGGVESTPLQATTSPPPTPTPIPASTPTPTLIPATHDPAPSPRRPRRRRPQLLRSDAVRLGAGAHQGFFSSRTLVAKPETTCDAHAEGKTCPLCSSYAATPRFWSDVAVAALLGCSTAVICFVIVLPMQRLPELWTPASYPQAPDSVQFLAGKPWWPAIIGGFGLAAGSLKVCVGFPAHYDGFFKQVGRQYVNPYDSAKVVAVSIVSVAGGAALGPSSVLASVGGGWAQVFAELREFPDDRVHRCCLHGMAAALACLFPSPLTPMLLIFELAPELQVGHHLKDFAEMGVSVISAYAVYLALAGRPYLPFIPLEGVLGECEFEFAHLLWGAAIGAVSGALGILVVLLVGLCMRGFQLLGGLLPHAHLRAVLLAGLGGCLVGLLGLAVPLSFGSGNSQLLHVLELATSGHMSPELLLLSALGKLFAVGLSVGCGFVGGFLFPTYFAGACCGLAAHQLVGLAGSASLAASLPLTVAMSCFLCAVPAALFPVPLTHLLNVQGMLTLSYANSAPMFVACIVASMCTGSGVLARMMRYARREIWL